MNTVRCFVKDFGDGEKIYLVLPKNHILATKNMSFLRENLNVNLIQILSSKAYCDSNTKPNLPNKESLNSWLIIMGTTSLLKNVYDGAIEILEIGEKLN